MVIKSLIGRKLSIFKLILTPTCGFVQVYSDLEVAFVISENQEVLDFMGKMGELLIGGTAISNQFYYGCLFQELLAFQLPGRHTKPQVWK